MNYWYYKSDLIRWIKLYFKFIFLFTRVYFTTFVARYLVVGDVLIVLFYLIQFLVCYLPPLPPRCFPNMCI
jgi:hypothetical protein